MPGLTLIIGNKNYSSWSLRPWIFLRHHQINFDEKRVPLFTDTTEAELAEYDSDFKVPVLIDKGHIVWDSLSILEYISETYLDNLGWPKDHKARAFARSISAEMHSSFFNVRNEMPMNCRKRFKNINFSQAAMREVVRITHLWRESKSHYGKHGDWLFGDFSIADAMFAPVALRFFGYNIPLEGIEHAYVSSILQHTAIIEWIDAGKLESEVIEEDEVQG